MEEGARRKGKRHRSSRARNEAPEKPYGNQKRRGEILLRNLSTLERELSDEIQTSERAKSNRLKAIKRKAESDIEQIRKRERIEEDKSNEEFDNQLTKLQSKLEEIRQLLKEFTECFADITAQKDALSLRLDKMCTEAEIFTGASKDSSNYYDEAIQATKDFIREEADVAPAPTKYVPSLLEQQGTATTRRQIQTWKLESQIHTGQPSRSKLIGSLSEDSLIIQNTSSSVCVVDINQGSTTITKIPDIPWEIIHCCHQANGYIAGIAREGRIFLCNQEWECLRNSSPPLMNTGAPSFLATNGNILTVSADGSQIHTLSVSDGSKVRSIKCGFEKVHGLLPIWFGNILVQTHCSTGEDICIVNGSGKVVRTFHFHEKKICDIAFDPSVESVYIMYEVQGEDELSVDVIRRGTKQAEIGRKELAISKELVRRPCSVRCLSGKLIMFTSGKFLIYKKS